MENMTFEELKKEYEGKSIDLQTFKRALKINQHTTYEECYLYGFIEYWDIYDLEDEDESFRVKWNGKIGEKLFEDYKRLFENAVLTDAILDRFEADLPKKCEINKEDYHSGIMCIGEELNKEMFRYEATKYSCVNLDTGEKFYFYA